ncbi:MAG: glycosyltransferase family 4 protein [Phycisphaerae bacterium]|nr:glycosyltransferase family 4 protein [Phycisphaerae bacterium]
MSNAHTDPCTDRPRLLAFSQVYPPHVGGSGLWMYRLVQAWPGPVTTLCQEHPLFRTDERQGDNRIRRIPFNFPSWAPDTLTSLKSYWTATRALKREIRADRPAAVLCGRGIPEGVAARWVGRVPYVSLAHGEEITTCLTSRKLQSLLRYSYRGARLVIANSSNTRQLAIQAGANPDRCIVIPPGVDSAALRPRPAGELPWPIPPGAMVVVTVGRLEPRKNQVGVIHAVAKLVAEGYNIHYVIAGTGVGKDAVERAVADTGMASHVTLVGEVSDADVRALYHRCDVFAMPSVQHGPSIEGFGIVFLEAAAAGKPAIAGTAGGSGEAVVHDTTGLVVDGTDIDAIYSALATYYDHPELRHAHGRKGQERAQQEFDWAIVAKRANDAILASIR